MIRTFVENLLGIRIIPEPVFQRLRDRSTELVAIHRKYDNGEYHHLPDATVTVLRSELGHAHTVQNVVYEIMRQSNEDVDSFIAGIRRPSA